MSAQSPARLSSAASPSSSQTRLPSPPPLPELQLGPQSPSINAPSAEIRLDNTAAQDEGAARRVRPGTSAVEMAKGPPFVPLHQLESPFQLQEYLKSAYCKATWEGASDTVMPITREIAMKLAAPPLQQDTGEPVDRNLWLYELCRFLVHRTNRLIVSFFADTPPCSVQTCPEMRASEWQYLCAVHEPPKSCCAIDYCCHTLDWAANVLTSSKHFPSRLALGGEGGNAFASMKQLTNIFRRVYRIYAHAWFQHREVFWSLEQEEGLYKFFKTVCDAYSLIPEDNYTVPPEAEGDREDMEETPVSEHPRDVQILRNETPVNQVPKTSPTKESEDSATLPSTGATTRRHRHTPSTGTQVTSIAEGAEEEEEHGTDVTRTQISQQVLADPSATSTNTTQPQSTSFPPKAPRSPPSNMSIPQTDISVDLSAPADPTPTPEDHKFDFFDDDVGAPPNAQSAATPATAPSSVSETSEQERPVTPPEPPSQSQPITLDTDEEPATPLSAINRGQSLSIIGPETPETGVRRAEVGDILHSPGGGSIRTISDDFLSGILAHCDVGDDGEPQYPESNKGAGSSYGSENSSWSLVSDGKIEKESQEVEDDKNVEEKTTTSTTATYNPADEEKEKTKENEDDEEMEEIKLGITDDLAASASKTDNIETEKVETESKREDTVKEGEVKEDIDKKEEAPAGVV